MSRGMCLLIDHRDYVTGIGNSSRDSNATRTKCFFSDDSFAGNAAMDGRPTSFILLYRSRGRAGTRVYTSGKSRRLHRIPLSLFCATGTIGLCGNRP